MDETALHAADEAYKAGDWRTAAREYLLAAGAGGPGTGVAFAKAGNALVKLGRHADAVMAYQRALDDPGLASRSAVLCNLGAAQAAADEHDAALVSFRAVLEDASYPKRYKALQGAAGSLAALSRFEEACEMYRAAALDASNPDPGKSLNSLGVCYLSQGRYDEAVEAFRAALGVDGYAGKGKAAANLGLALCGLGRSPEAIEAFERATGEFGHALNDEALAAYEACKRAVAQPKRETVEGWRTGEMPPVFADDDEDLSFFTRTEEEMKQADREARRAERAARRQQQGLLVRVGSVVAVAAVVVGLLGFLWASGIGFPTQQMTVKGLLEAHRAGKPVDGYWVAVPAVDVEKEMSALPPRFTSYKIGSVDRSAKTSTVEVTVVLEQGAPLAYKVSLAREGVGWKVSGIANDWRSTGD
ncbi:tetratricopeptide repeat protein [Coriobacteriia bacterium Es71-Z0120]|uniref:tetratricopeptide repeat protein n=1 Tax=Parvivirga hydrogeniphila TaxID=2939460 RepID=UPI00226087D9|nr:tetratricopeptide repeat protein [Parvivirga hydrogeniphila]MCL4078950.1 tetratricopeptide repeat protein [Parvivirga hydrogeniphila]